MISKLKEPRNTKIKLISILTVALLLRVSLYFLSNNNTNADSKGYLQFAQNFFTMLSSSTLEHIELSLLRTPGYPFFLKIINIGPNLNHIFWIQIALSILTIFLVYRLSIEIFENTNAALVSAFLITIDLGSIAYPSLILTETLFTFILTISVYLLLLHCKKDSNTYLVLSALAFSILTYLKPISLYLPLFLAIVFTVIATKHKRNQFHKSIIFLLIYSSIISVWMYRNYSLTNKPFLFTSMQSNNLLYWRGARVKANAEGISFRRAQRQLKKYNKIKVKDAIDFGKKITIEQKMGFRILIKNFWQTIIEECQGYLRIIGGTGIGVLQNLAISKKI